MNVFLVRHGECCNTKLTSNGKKQARVIAKQLKQHNISKIYSSPTDRCKESAQIIAKILKKDLFIVEGFKERFSLEHNPQNDTESEWWDNYMNLDYKNKTMETLRDFVERNKKELNALFDKHFKKNENIVVVAHSASLYAFNAVFFGITAGILPWTGMGNCSVVKFEKVK